MSALDQLVYVRNNYVSKIENANNHIFVVYDGSSKNKNDVIEIAYKELEYVINKITYEVYKLKNSVLFNLYNYINK